MPLTGETGRHYTTRTLRTFVSEIWEAEMDFSGFQPFNREDHVYRSDAFVEMVKDAVQFFYKTPVAQLPPPLPFDGCGVYAIYCTAREGIYSIYGTELNRFKINVPIYVGSAISAGARQARSFGAADAGRQLYNRLVQHSRSIFCVRNLALGNFCCRFMILDGQTQTMATAIESMLISLDSPLWNGIVDGFGNHNPGKNRMDGDRPAWDVLHPGRPWADGMPIRGMTVAGIRKRVTDYLYGKVNRRDHV